jgi:YHS domain-containing protein
MLRVLLITALVIFAIRAIGRLLGGIIDGVAGQSGGAPARGVAMVKDPVCGTFVVPGQALTLVERGQQVYFCSTKCRDAYRTRSA